MGKIIVFIILAIILALIIWKLIKRIKEGRSRIANKIAAEQRKFKHKIIEKKPKMQNFEGKHPKWFGFLHWLSFVFFYIGRIIVVAVLIIGIPIGLKYGCYKVALNRLNHDETVDSLIFSGVDKQCYVTSDFDLTDKIVVKGKEYQISWASSSENAKIDANNHVAVTRKEDQSESVTLTKKYKWGISTARIDYNVNIIKTGVNDSYTAIDINKVVNGSYNKDMHLRVNEEGTASYMRGDFNGCTVGNLEEAGNFTNTYKQSFGADTNIDYRPTKITAINNIMKYDLQGYYKDYPVEGATARLCVNAENFEPFSLTISSPLLQVSNTIFPNNDIFSSDNYDIFLNLDSYFADKTTILEGVLIEKIIYEGQLCAHGYAVDIDDNIIELYINCINGQVEATGYPTWFFDDNGELEDKSSEDNLIEEEEIDTDQQDKNEAYSYPFFYEASNLKPTTGLDPIYVESSVPIISYKKKKLINDYTNVIERKKGDAIPIDIDGSLVLNDVVYIKNENFYKLKGNEKDSKKEDAIPIESYYYLNEVIAYYKEYLHRDSYDNDGGKISLLYNTDDAIQEGSENDQKYNEGTANFQYDIYGTDKGKIYNVSDGDFYLTFNRKTNYVNEPYNTKTINTTYIHGKSQNDDSIIINIYPYGHDGIKKYVYSFSSIPEVFAHEFTHSIMSCENYTFVGQEGLERCVIDEGYADVMGLCFKTRFHEQQTGEILSYEDWRMAENYVIDGSSCSLVCYRDNAYYNSNKGGAVPVVDGRPQSEMKGDDVWNNEYEKGIEGDEHLLSVLVSHIACEMYANKHFGHKKNDDNDVELATYKDKELFTLEDIERIWYLSFIIAEKEYGDDAKIEDVYTNLTETLAILKDVYPDETKYHEDVWVATAGEFIKRSFEIEGFEDLSSLDIYETRRDHVLNCDGDPIDSKIRFYYCFIPFHTSFNNIIYVHVESDLKEADRKYLAEQIKDTTGIKVVIKDDKIIPQKVYRLKNYLYGPVEILTSTSNKSEYTHFDTIIRYNLFSGTLYDYTEYLESFYEDPAKIEEFAKQNAILQQQAQQPATQTMP